MQFRFLLTVLAVSSSIATTAIGSDFQRASDAAYCIGAMQNSLTFWNTPYQANNKREQEIYEQIKQQLYENQLKPTFEHYRNIVLTYSAINSPFFEASLLLTLQGENDSELCKKVVGDCGHKYSSNDQE